MSLTALNAQDSLSFFENAPRYHSGRVRGVVIGEVATYTMTMAGLNQLWYADFERSGFHLFNDNSQWLQMDKMGHAFSAYYGGKLGIDLLRWSGVSHKKSVWLGGTLGLAFLTTVEVLDGFSTEWGFSFGDMGFNLAGTGLLIGQELLWKDQRLQLKFSYTPTDLAQLRPEVLGTSWNERIIKDYNGQTIWLSGNISSFLSESNQFPKWLNVAIGYGVDGLLGGELNPTIIGDRVLPLKQRSRQYYLSLDVDLYRIRTKHAWLNAALKTVGILKVPFPALEYHESEGFQFKALQF